VQKGKEKGEQKRKRKLQEWGEDCGGRKGKTPIQLCRDGMYRRTQEKITNAL